MALNYTPAFQTPMRPAPIQTPAFQTPIQQPQQPKQLKYFRYENTDEVYERSTGQHMTAAEFKKRGNPWGDVEIIPQTQMLQTPAREEVKPKPKSILDKFLIPKKHVPEVMKKVEVPKKKEKPKTLKEFFEPTPEVRTRDVIREIPGVLKDIGQDTARNIASAGVTIGKVLGGVDEVKPPKALEFLLRDEPIKSIEQRVAEAEISLKDWGEKNKGTIWGDLAKENPELLAFGAIMGSVGLDLTPFGGMKAPAFKAIKQADTIFDAVKVLTKMGVADDLAREFAEQVIKTKTDDAAEKLFTHLANVQRTTKPVVSAGDNLPTVVKRETFTLGTSKITQPTIKELKTGLKTEIKATKQELRNADIAFKKAQALKVRQQKIRTNTIENINRQHGNTARIIKNLKKKHLSPEDIDNIILEDGTKLVDTVKIKRNTDKSLASVITKTQINDLARTYTGKSPERWVRKYSVARVGEKVGDMGQLYELPQVYFERRGLSTIYDTMINEGDRVAESTKNAFFKRFKDAGLYKEGGWFTADRFKLSGKEADKIGKYYLSRQKKGYKVSYESLSTKEKKFVDIFDDIIKETEPKFFEVAKKNGKTPTPVKGYAPIMTRNDIKLIDHEIGNFEFIMRKHPAFFSLKERAKKVPVILYETDYRKVAARWLDGVTKFNATGDVAPDVKYLLNSDEFQKIVNPKDYETILAWFKDTISPQVPTTPATKSVNFIARFLRQTSAVASLGLNYASVVKQVLTQVPLTIIAKAPPKFKSQFAKAFKISVKDLPSLTARKGNIAIQDLQGKVGRIFTGPLTKFDKINAQLSLNRLLDQNWQTYLKQGAEITPEIQNLIIKKAQDTLDLWYGGMVSTGQRPQAFRSELGKFINMFIYPLTSQLNGFYRHIYQAKGFGNAKAIAEVAAAATTIAYLEQVITNLSPKWSDEKEMTKDILVSLTGNIPIIGQIVWSFAMDDQLQVSAGVSGIETLRRKLIESSKGMAEPGEVGFAVGETLGLPKFFRRTFYEGMRIIEEGGIKDKNGKMLVPVKEADEIIRSFLRGKYGSNAAKDWIRNIGEKKENRRWFVDQVEFLQNGDYDRKAELYKTFSKEEKKELYGYLSEGQQNKLDNKLEVSMDTIFNKDSKKTKMPWDSSSNEKVKMPWH